MRQVVHWIVGANMNRNIGLTEGSRLGRNLPLSNLTSGCMRGEDLVTLKENCIRNSERYHNVMKIIPPQPRPLHAITTAPPPPHHHSLLPVLWWLWWFYVSEGCLLLHMYSIIIKPSTDIVFLIFPRLPSFLSAHVKWGGGWGGRSCKIVRLYLIFCIKQIFSWVHQT